MPHVLRWRIHAKTFGPRHSRSEFLDLIYSVLEATIVRWKRCDHWSPPIAAEDLLSSLPLHRCIPLLGEVLDAFGDDRFARRVGGKVVAKIRKRAAKAPDEVTSQDVFA